MSKLEEIKERHKTGYVQTFIDEQELLGQWRSDIRYLIEEVERLNRSLLDVAHIIKSDPEYAKKIAEAAAGIRINNK